MQPVLYASVLETRNYIVGAANASSGLFRHGGIEWAHMGWTNVRAFGVAVDPFDPLRLAIAGGNGVLVSVDAGSTWRVTTDWRITEVLAVAFDPRAQGTILAATAYGLWVSRDGAANWMPMLIDGAPNETFTSAISADHTTHGRWFRGTESGLQQSEDDGGTWTTSRLNAPIRKIKQSPGDALFWYAATEDHGIYRSTDGGLVWGVVHDADTIYALAVNPCDTRVVAAGGYETGLLMSMDAGATWTRRQLDAPTQSVCSLAFDPHVSGRLWGGLVNEGLFVTRNFGLTCEAAGLPEATVSSLVFAPFVS